jgi:hypothetical protein
MVHFHDGKRIVPQLSDEEYRTAVAFILDIKTFANEINIKFQENAKLLCDLFSDMHVRELQLNLLHKRASEEQPSHFPFRKTVLKSPNSQGRLAHSEGQA